MIFNFLRFFSLAGKRYHAYEAFAGYFWGSSNGHAAGFPAILPVIVLKLFFLYQDEVDTMD